MLGLLDGWKTIIGYVILAVGGSTPLLKTAVEEVAKDPNPTNIINAVGQVLLAVGVASRAYKNVRR